MREEFEKFRNEKNSKITIIIKLHGNKTEIEYIDKYVDVGLISIR